MDTIPANAKEFAVPHKSFVTTTLGLRRDSPPMILFEKSKRLGTWNPSDLDFTRDLEDWKNLTDIERDAILQLTSLFAGGEEAVTLDLLPLIHTIALEGRVEEEIYLTSFLWEEAKHTDFFARFVTEVAGESGDLSHYQQEHYRSIFYEALPQAMGALTTDRSHVALARASTTYNLVVEGIIAETGYHAYFLALDKQGILPATRKGISLVKQDEARHLAYGIYLLSRLMSEDPSLWDVVQETMNELLPKVMGLIHETFTRYETPPFGESEETFASFAMGQFQKRLDRLQRARGMSAAEVDEMAEAIIEADDA
jgi:ribonucleoside-diphosphate reductase beta chain